MNNINIEGSRKIIVAAISMIIAFVGAQFNIQTDMFYYSIMTIAGTFFGANMVEHGTNAYKKGKELSSQTEDIKELIKKALEGEKNNDENKISNKEN